MGRGTVAPTATLLAAQFFPLGRVAANCNRSPPSSLAQRNGKRTDGSCIVPVPYPWSETGFRDPGFRAVDGMANIGEVHLLRTLPLESLRARRDDIPKCTRLTLLTAPPTLAGQ